MYVQEAVESQKERICDVLFKENGCLYLCGSEGMVKDVNAIVVQAAKERFGAEGMKEVNKAKGDRRFVQESWG